MARLTDGQEIYPHRPDLFDLPFWVCDECGNYVGCHHKTSDRTRPLGSIPTDEVRAIRQSVHRVIDPLWRSGTFSRKAIYEAIGRNLGFEFHTGEITNQGEADAALSALERVLPSLPRLKPSKGFTA